MNGPDILGGSMFTVSELIIFKTVILWIYSLCDTIRKQGSNHFNILFYQSFGLHGQLLAHTPLWPINKIKGLLFDFLDMSFFFNNDKQPSKQIVPAFSFHDCDPQNNAPWRSFIQSRIRQYTKRFFWS